jgi:glycosyltransferase involved in cell wall biosynthesis
VTGADVLYLSYDGMTDPLGRSQVLPYLVGLAARGHRIRLVSLDKPALFERHRGVVEEICRAAGIAWHPRPFRSGILLVAVPRNLRALRKLAEQLIAERRPDLVHCRSDLPGMVGLALKRERGIPFLYDMRAFWPDERAEGGAWDQRKWVFRRVFRYFKARQKEMIEAADHIVTLAEEGRKALLAMNLHLAGPISVIPCCADFSHFTLADPAVRASRREMLGVPPGAPLLIHLGTTGPNAMLGAMLDFVRLYRKRHADARMLFLTPERGDDITAAGRARGLDAGLHVRSATREEVPQWLAAADLGLFFVRPVWSKKGASPTKMGELLAAGLPVIANAGVGDVAEIVRECGAGAVVDSFDRAAYDRAIDELEATPRSPEAIREAARRWFDLEVGITAYDRIYRSMR